MAYIYIWYSINKEQEVTLRHKAPLASLPLVSVSEGSLSGEAGNHEIIGGCLRVYLEWAIHLQNWHYLNYYHHEDTYLSKQHEPEVKK
jgi:hypothetical protein